MGVHVHNGTMPVRHVLVCSRSYAGEFAPWAHHSDDERTVATFYCSDEWKPEA